MLSKLTLTKNHLEVKGKIPSRRIHQSRPQEEFLWLSKNHSWRRSQPSSSKLSTSQGISKVSLPNRAYLEQRRKTSWTAIGMITTLTWRWEKVRQWWMTHYRTTLRFQSTWELTSLTGSSIRKYASRRQIKPSPIWQLTWWTATTATAPHPYHNANYNLTG